MQAMNTPDTPASAADIQAIKDAAQQRQDEVLCEAKNLILLAQHVRDSNMKGRVLTATHMEKAARMLMDLVS